MNTNKRKTNTTDSDMNKNEIVDRLRKRSTIQKLKSLYTIGQIKELSMVNFMSHKNFSIQFHSTHMQIVTGANGSGKSAIPNAISLCLGAPARTTGRTSTVQSFIRKGETAAEIRITIANQGPEAFKPEAYGNEIQIIRRIGVQKSNYKILDSNRKLISKRKETIDEILQAFSISPDNPICILHQEIAKHFLINSDSKRKYHFYIRVSQLEQIKQTHEQALYTIQSLTKRVDSMKQKHINMVRELAQLEQQLTKFEIRRNYAEKKRLLEAELIAVRAEQAKKVIAEYKCVLARAEQSKTHADLETNEIVKELTEIDKRLDNYSVELKDSERDLNELNNLKKYFSEQRLSINSKVQHFTHECERYRQILTDIELEQIHVQKQIDEYGSTNQHSCDLSEQRRKIEEDLSCEQEKQIQLNKLLLKLNDDKNICDENVCEQEETIDFLKNQLTQKQFDLNQLINAEQNKIHVYGLWMSGCLRAIEMDQRFHKKPIGPIGIHVKCRNSYWSYAIEKHLSPVMSSFICENKEDEAILLEIFAFYATDHRPTVFVRKYCEQLHDISGTLKHIKQANLLSMYDVLEIDNVTVACTLIDLKYIEATILVENLQEIKKIKESGVLSWTKHDRIVRQVLEAWTVDGSNIKLDRTFRIYTNDKQPMKYFSESSLQILTRNDYDNDIKDLNERIEAHCKSTNELKLNRQKMIDEIAQIKTDIMNNQIKMNQLNKEIDRCNSTIPTVIDCNFSELNEKVKILLSLYNDTVSKYDDMNTKKQEYMQQSIDANENCERVEKKIDAKIQEYDNVVEQSNIEKSNRHEFHEKLLHLQKKLAKLDKDINQYQNKIEQLNRYKIKETNTTVNILRSVRDVQRDIAAINKYLKDNQDTNEHRRDFINLYRTKRDAVKQYKQTYERCYRQIQCLNEFVRKRQERFITITEQHQYYIRTTFRKLMKKYDFDDSDIRIDHKNEELELIIKRDQNDVAMLSGGERSISTFCFLLALWESIYQPFRLIDEIDIYMDNVKSHSLLECLHENTENYSSSQHIVFTPKLVDAHSWNRMNVPIFNMPPPKRSLLEFDDSFI